jgi:hypothetical protein
MVDAALPMPKPSVELRPKEGPTQVEVSKPIGRRKLYP